jgi:hypothetical protein
MGGVELGPAADLDGGVVGEGAELGVGGGEGVVEVGGWGVVVGLAPGLGAVLGRRRRWWNRPCFQTRPFAGKPHHAYTSGQFLLECIFPLSRSARQRL